MLNFQSKEERSKNQGAPKAGYFSGWALSLAEVKTTANTGEEFLTLQFSKDGQKKYTNYFLPVNWNEEKDFKTGLKVAKTGVNQFKDYTAMTYRHIYSLSRMYESFFGRKAVLENIYPILEGTSEFLEIKDQVLKTYTDEQLAEKLKDQRELVSKFSHFIADTFGNSYGEVSGVLLLHYALDKEGTKSYLSTPPTSRLSPYFKQYYTKNEDGTINYITAEESLDLPKEQVKYFRNRVPAASLAPFLMTDENGHTFTKEFVIKDVYVNKDNKKAQFTIKDYPLAFDPITPKNLPAESNEVNEEEGGLLNLPNVESEVVAGDGDAW